MNIAVCVFRPVPAIGQSKEWELSSIEPSVSQMATYIQEISLGNPVLGANRGLRFDDEDDIGGVGQNSARSRAGRGIFLG